MKQLFILFFVVVVAFVSGSCAQAQGAGQAKAQPQTAGQAHAQPQVTVQSQPQDKRSPTALHHLHLAALAKGYEDSVVVRWAPADPQAWVLGNKAGYHVIRIDLSQPGHPQRTDLSPAGIFPTPKDQLLKGLDTANPYTKYLAVAAKMLYGGDYSVSKTQAPSFVGQLKNEHSALSLKYMIAMMCADYDAAAATALGLRWVDRDVQKGGKYVYIITSPATNVTSLPTNVPTDVPADKKTDKSFVIDSTEVFALNVKKKTEPLPQGLQATAGDRKVSLQWNRRQTGNFSGYWIERSDDGGATYHSLTKGPFNAAYIPPSGDKKKDSIISKQNPLLKDHQLFVDSLPENYKKYYYRIRGVNGFAERSPYTASVPVAGRDLTPPSAPLIDSVRNTAGRNVRLWWKQLHQDGDLAGYYVDRGTSAKGPFKLITPKMLDKNTTVFTDTAALSHQPNFYVVVAVDTAKNSAISLPGLSYLTDTIPPAAPLRVAGTIDSSGIVHLHWSANKEQDLKGYQVYSSYSASNRFSQITQSILTDTTFTDSVATQSLDRRVYYRIVALDQNFNHSPQSATAILRKIVVIPPSAPVAGKVTVGHSTINIEWTPSRSEGAIGYQVYRKEAGKEWQPLIRLTQDWTGGVLHLTDSSIRPNTDYYYSAETIDSTGVRSARSFAVRANDHEALGIPGVRGFMASLDPKGKSIQLKWQLPVSPADYFYIIYRSVNDGPLNRWHSVDKGTVSYQDESIQQATYHYAIQILSRNPDMESALSQVVSVGVPGNTNNHSSR